jgi:hypothetical protein
MEFKHPNYYKELRKRNKSDQAISLRAHDGERERAPGPGLKQQAIDETVPYNDIEEAQAPSSKHQATSVKPQAQKASSDKLQAPSSKLQA